MDPLKIENEAEETSLKLKLEASIRSRFLVSEALGILEGLKKDNPGDASIQASIARLKNVIGGDNHAIDGIQARLVRVFERDARPGHDDRVARLTSDIDERVRRGAGKRPRGGP